jgi:hypothetical protein
MPISTTSSLPGTIGFGVEPKEVIAIVEFGALSSALVQSESLPSAVGNFLTYDWLPVEGGDFTVRYDGAHVNGVGLESEAFYAPVTLP